MTVKDIKDTDTLRGVMFMNSRNHEAYCKHVKGILDNPPACGFFPKLFFFLATLFKKINLDGAVKFLIERKKYSILGRRAHDPANMIRACLVAIFLGINFDTLTHEILRNESYAELCGFDPANPPGEATFYDFMDRIWDGKTKNVSATFVQQLTPKPEKPPKGEKAAPVDKITCAELLEKQKNVSYDRASEPFFTWMALFDIIALDVSLRNGTIDPNNLDLACDGTPVETSARIRKHKYCPINPDENYKRKCKDMSDEEKRKLSCYNPETGKFLCETDEYAGLSYVHQPDTNIGWDSSRDRYFNGYHLFLYTDVRSGLPIFPVLNPASTHDSHALIKSLDKLRTYYPVLVIKKLIADSAFDFKEIYDHLDEIGIEPIIDLNLRRATGTRSGGIVVTKDGPVCKENIQMCLKKIDRDAGVAVYSCPKMVKENGTWRCTCTSPCSSAKNGRTTTVLLSMLKEEIVNTPDKVRKKREGEFRLPDGFHADESGAICCAHGEMKLLTVNRQCGKAVYKCPMMEKDENGNLQCMCPNPCSKAKTGRTLQTPIGYPNHTGPVDSDSSEAQEQEPDAGPAHTVSEPGMNPPVSDAALNQDAALPEDSTVEAASGVNPPVLEGHAPDSAELNQHAVLPENSAAVFNPVTKLVVENGDTSNKDTSHKKLLEWDPRFNKEGKAICPLGIPLKSDGTNPKCQTAMFLCPRMTTDANGNVVNTCPNPCEAAKGEHIAIPLAVNRRFLNSTPRDSDEWKEIYKDRIASERVNKRIKCDLHLEAGRHRSGSKWYGRLYLIMILLHAMAWPDPVTAKTP